MTPHSVFCWRAFLLVALTFVFGACAVGLPIEHDLEDASVAPPKDGDPDEPVPPGCGNGQLDPGELCDDTAPGNECACEGVRSSEDACVMGKIVAGSPKACNVVCDFVDARDQYGVGHCDDGDPCTQDILAGDPDSCDIECTHLPQDCPAVCGDGIVDEDEETCDDGPDSPTTCPQSVDDCDDGDPCTDDLLLGSASQCNAVCVNSERKEGYGYDTCDDGDPCTEDIVLAHSPETCSIQCDHKTISGYEITHCDDGNPCTIDTIRSGDPSTCTSIQCEHENVENCGAACHDGEVQPEYGEYCDDGPGSPTPCPKSVDDCVADNACIRFNLIGSHEVCTARCAPYSYDPGYGHTTCDDNDACTIDTVVSGSPDECSMTCAHHDTRNDPDEPDDLYTDSNCDGFDGDLSRTIFVATNGSDEYGEGSYQLPFATIGRGIQVAKGRSDFLGVDYYVAVAAGTYNERVYLEEGVHVHGGYARTLDRPWPRASNNVTRVRATNVINSRIEAVVADGISKRTVFDHFVVETGNMPSSVAGGSVYGVRVVNSTHVELRNLQVHAGNASDGTAGAAGATGAGGASGKAGTHGNNVSRGSRAGGGDGGYVSCPTGRSTRGGKGGDGGYDGNAAVCGARTEPTAGAAPDGVACNVGSAGAGARSCGGPNSSSGGTGQSCSPATTPNGEPASLPTLRGSVSAGGVWSGTAGLSNGTHGENGVGGSGGGGGGGGDCGTLCRGGNGGGGGGGSGGCGGLPGKGGTAAGSSFGLFVYNSSSIAVEKSHFTSGSGGAGGAGGAGGHGGAGGGGGAGGNAGSSSNPSWAIDVKAAASGGRGGSGRAGGRGGGGSGGSGGVSVAQLVCNSSVSGISNATGTPGNAGAGGSGGSPNGRNGLVGIASAYSSACSF